MTSVSHGRMETVFQDVRYAVRTLGRQRGFTAAAVVTLALGIGGTAAVFTVVNAVLLRPLPYPEGERLVTVWSADARGQRSAMSALDFEDIRDSARSFETVAAALTSTVSLTAGGEAEEIAAAYVTASYFDVLAVRPTAGRTLARDDAPGVSAVISAGLWRRAFGAAPSAIGDRVPIAGRSAVIVGVMPADFVDPNGAEIWLPLVFAADDRRPEQRGARNLRGIGRLKPGIGAATAQAEVAGIAERLSRAHPGTNENLGARVDSLFEQTVAPVRQSLVVVFVAVVMVLLIACANVANLFLARAATRHGEMSLRAALGASRARLVRQLLTESLLVALTGGFMGVLLAGWGVRVITTLAASRIPRFTEISIDPLVVAFATLTAILSGVAFGLVPAFRSSQVQMGTGLNPREAGSRYDALRRTLGVAEVALALVLLTGALLLVKTLERLSAADLGFHGERVTTFTVRLPEARYSTAAASAAFHERLLDELNGVPGVESTGAVFGLPLGRVSAVTSFTRSGAPQAEGHLIAAFRVIGGNYLATLGIPIVAGRAFHAGESIPVAMINETAAARYWPGENPVGKRIDVGMTMVEGAYTGEREIIGVIRDVRVRGPEASISPEIYLPLTQQPVRRLSFVLRTTSGGPGTVLPAVRQRVRSIDPDLPISAVASMTELQDNYAATRRFYMQLLSAFAGVALLLALVGVYAVIAYDVSQRAREIAIRMAIGATPRVVVGRVVRQALGVAVAGTAVGTLGAFAVSRSLASLLYGTSPTDPATFVGACAVLFGTTLVASYLPARRAARIAPADALRSP